MRTGLWISIALLCATILLGWWEEQETERISQRYVSAAEEMRVLSDKDDWPRAREIAASYLADWQRIVLIFVKVNRRM